MRRAPIAVLVLGLALSACAGGVPGLNLEGPGDLSEVHRMAGYEARTGGDLR